jgi:iron transport multicopper oxidase
VVLGLDPDNTSGPFFPLSPASTDSLLIMLRSIFLATAYLCLTSRTCAETISYDWNLCWVIANPDGRLARPVVGINGEWPNPAIEAKVGDRIQINLNNQLGNETTSLHFHGLFQEGSNGMDGPPAVTQCQIPPGTSFTYDFVVC